MKRILICLLGLMPFAPLQAEDQTQDESKNDFHGCVGARGTGVRYSPDAPRERFTSAGLFLDLDERRWFGLSLGWDGDQVRLKGEKDTPQSNAYGNLRIYIPVGESAGKLILRGDAQALQYRSQDDASLSARMVGAHLGYLSDVDPTVARCYLDVAFNKSTYPEDFVVEQWTPTLGLGFNANADWFSLSGTQIRTRPVQPLLAQTVRSWRIAWTHFFLPGMALKPATFGLSGQGGRRIFAVDGDLGLMVNHGDTQTGSWAASLSWKGGAWSLGFDGGQSNWEATTQTRYTSAFLTTSLKYSW